MSDTTTKTVRHEGKIISITPQVVTVKIESSSLCAACHAKGACTAADKAEKIIEAVNLYNLKLEVGEHVSVTMKRSLGMRAVVISYVVPLIILLFLLLTLHVLQLGELWTGLISLVGVGLYYLGLFLFKKRIASDFVFTIDKQ